MSLRRALFGVVVLAVACGGAGTATPTKSPDVLIPRASDSDPSSAKDDDDVPPADRRVEVGPEVPAEAPPDDIWGTYASGAARGGVDCDRAADCCMKFYQKSLDPSVQRICGSLRSAPSQMCSILLTNFQSTAPSIGVSCP